MLIPSTGMDNKNDNIFSIKIALNAKRISSGIMNTYATKRFIIMKNIAVSPVITVSSTNITQDSSQIILKGKNKIAKGRVKMFHIVHIGHVNSVIGSNKIFKNQSIGGSIIQLNG